MASPDPRVPRRKGLFRIILASALSFTGCSDSPRQEEEVSPNALKPVVLQLDWVPEAAHGGFYLALAEGYYEDAGLDVTIVAGGPGTNPLNEVVLGKADFSISRMDDILLALQRGLPLAAVASYHQHDPQGILLHEKDPAESFADLDGRKVMIIPGGAFVRWLEQHYAITLQVIPLDYGIQRFVMDKELVQQCFVTSQPFFLKQQGIPTRTLLAADSGFDPGRVIYAKRATAKRDPGLVAAFIDASLRGWKAYVYGDREKADAMILALNPSASPELNAFSVGQMRELHILEGRPGLELGPGTLPPTRIDAIITLLNDIGLLETPLAPESVVPYEWLPDYIRDPSALPASVRP